ncbi:hypothetical protein [Magnetospirillum sp. UT-4]|uniref:hypothetical protein n=1 Tax=Magnetospirillum sp. UT-4 TaxID=2681467 RepID=UPI001381D780|nr:hypothetical protein [Magnetospirillum sp. UT-4]CAA7618729.1 hypothetical protein MTBUT4_30171 [Magnetospirillum sp. UT-4]
MTTRIGAAPAGPGALAKIPMTERTAQAAAVAKRLDEAPRGPLQLAVDLARGRKALARQSLDALKRQIAALALVSMLDPKAAARQIRDLARRVAGAARDWCDAGPDPLPADPAKDATSPEVAARPAGEVVAARPLGEVVAARPPGEAMRDVALARYQRNQAAIADRSGLDDASELYAQLKRLMDFALRLARQKDAQDRELDDIAGDFARSGDDIGEASRGWESPAEAPVPMPETVRVVV